MHFYFVKHKFGKTILVKKTLVLEFIWVYTRPAYVAIYVNNVGFGTKKFKYIW